MNTKNIEFEIAVRKLDNIVEKIYNNENKLTDKEENLDSINLVSMLIIELGLKFSSNYIIFNEILNYAIKFYSENCSLMLDIKILLHLIYHYRYIRLI